MGRETAHTMTAHAKLNVTTGPDRGKSFELGDGVAHIGTGAENQVILTDASVAHHQVSIASRNGRFFIYTPASSSVEVDGVKILPEQRVWLPSEALIQLSRRTAVEFVGQVDESAPGSTVVIGHSSVAEITPAPTPTPRTKRATGERPDSVDNLTPPTTSTSRVTKKSPNVARFITDGPGDMRVKLGEDGHLPELTLDDSQGVETRETGNGQSNPLILIAVMFLSCASILAMLFMDADNFGSAAAEKGRAQREIGEFYGREGEELKPYQTHLRFARLARSRHDVETERMEYRKVLELLHAEGKSKFTGLTGSVERDHELEHMISVLLGN